MRSHGPRLASGFCVFMTIYEATKEFLDWRQHQNKAMVTHIQNHSNLRQFAIFMRNCQIEDVQEKDVLEYLSLIEVAMGAEGNSMIPKVNALRQLFKYMNQRNFRTMNYELIPLRRKEFTMPKLCTHEEFLTFWKAVAAPSNDSRKIRNAALIALIGRTGIRNGEACGILLKDVDVETPALQDGAVVMYRGVIKTEKSRGMKPFREIYWDQEANTIIKKWVNRRASLETRHAFKTPEYLFLGLNSRFGDEGWGRKLTPNAVDELFRRYSRDAGVKIRPHMLRHLLGRDMAEQDASDHIISDVLGHSRLDSSRTYTRLFGKAVGRQFYRFRGSLPKVEEEEKYRK